MLVESSIDALSAASVAKLKTGATMFVASDGTGAVPTRLLQQHQGAGVQIVAAHDGDRAGEEMAWRLATEVAGIVRATPAVGKDWNDQLKGTETQVDPAEWKLVAQAIGKSEDYVNRIVAVVGSGQPLPVEAAAAMRQDFDTYKQTSSDLWQWHQAARDIGRSEAYLKRITEVAIAFHHPQAPVPLPSQTVATMQQDLSQHEQVLTSKLWKHYSQDADPAHPMKIASIVAYGAAKDNHSPEKINQILLQDPALMKIRQRSGEQAAQNHLKIAMRLVDHKMRSHLEQSNQNNKQQQSQPKPGLQL